MAKPQPARLSPSAGRPKAQRRSVYQRRPPENNCLDFNERSVGGDRKWNQVTMCGSPERSSGCRDVQWPHDGVLASHLRPGSGNHSCLFPAWGLTIKLKMEPDYPQTLGHLSLVKCRFLGPRASDSKGPGGLASAFWHAFSQWLSGGLGTTLKGTGSWSRRLRF